MKKNDKSFTPIYDHLRHTTMLSTYEYQNMMYILTLQDEKKRKCEELN